MSDAEEVSEFKVGDLVVIDGDDRLGRLNEIPPARHITFVQSKMLTGSGFQSGGSCLGWGWKEGYPKPLTDPDDVLFAKAVQLQIEASNLATRLEVTRRDIEALERARKLLAVPQQA